MPLKTKIVNGSGHEIACMTHPEIVIDFDFQI